MRHSHNVLVSGDPLPRYAAIIGIGAYTGFTKVERYSHDIFGICPTCLCFLDVITEVCV